MFCRGSSPKSPSKRRKISESERKRSIRRTYWPVTKKKKKKKDADEGFVIDVEYLIRRSIGKGLTP